MTDRTEGEMEALSDDRLVMFEMWCREHHDRQPAYVTRRQKTGLALLAELRRLRGLVEEAQRAEQEMRAVAETYGRVELERKGNQRAASLRYDVMEEVMRAGGFDVFMAALRDCRQQWDAYVKKLRAPNPTTGAE